MRFGVWGLGFRVCGVSGKFCMYGLKTRAGVGCSLRAKGAKRGGAQGFRATGFLGLAFRVEGFFVVWATVV